MEYPVDKNEFGLNFVKNDIRTYYQKSIAKYPKSAFF
jgi:hypothetical protein